MDPPADNRPSPVLLLTGGSGYVGGRLIPLLEQQPVRLRWLARSPEKMRSRVQPGTDIVQGDVLDPASLDRALHGVQTAYYLVHLMSGSKDFEKKDRQAATTHQMIVTHTIRMSAAASGTLRSPAKIGMNSRLATRFMANGRATFQPTLRRTACTNTNPKLTRMIG
jgi:uncharacterized protein YbjT (DUF2867 family)